MFDLSEDIEFDNVNFIYPSRKDVSVLRNLSLIARAGQTTALVGSSGCGKLSCKAKIFLMICSLLSLIGKSTCVSLILRQYDLSSGQIKIGDRPITNFNLKQLRQNIGVVSQEPVCFYFYTLCFLIEY
jgi:ABC-type multidrug transport system fused ATPase/permease subunit